MTYKSPLELANAIQTKNHPFKLDKQKYPDVEETPYGFIYNVGNQSITDHTAMRRYWAEDAKNRKLNRPVSYDSNTDYGWTVTTTSGDEVYYPDFESAYKAAKGVK